MIDLHQHFHHVCRRVALLHQIDEPTPCTGNDCIAPGSGGMVSDFCSV
jgi:hypothetical protein